MTLLPVKQGKTIGHGGIQDYYKQQTIVNAYC